jgi:hypothetical protein
MSDNNDGSGRGHGADSVSAGPRQFYEQASDPTTQANSGWVYAKDASGVTELFYKDSSGSVTQLTSGGSVGAPFFADNIEAKFGNTAAAPDAALFWNTTQTVDALFLGLPAAQNVFIIAEYADKAYDFAHGAQTNPTLFIQSANQSATEWLAISHAQTKSLYHSGYGAHAFTQVAQTSGTGLPIMIVTSSAHSGMTAATESISVNFNCSAGRTWAAGAGPLATQRCFLIQAPTYNGDAGGPLTITKAATLSITGAPIQGSNLTITNSYALDIVTGRFNVGTVANEVAFNVAPATYSIAAGNSGRAIYFQPTMTEAASGTHAVLSGVEIAPFTITAGAGATSRAYGLLIGAPTGASNNFALALNGNVLMLPTTNLTIHDAGGLTNVFLTATAAQATVFNESSVDIDFRIESDNLASMFHIDAGLDALGIGAAPTTGQFLAITEPVRTGGSPNGLTFTGGAHTTLAKNTEASDIYLNLARTVQFATVDTSFGSQNAIKIVAPTYAFVGSSTLTAATTLSLNAPSAGANAIITNTRALSLGSAVTASVLNNAADATFSLLNTSTQGITLATTTQVTSACAAAAGRFGIITISQSGGAVTVDAAATVYIQGAVAAGGSVTITKPYSFWIDAGLPRIDSTTANAAVACVLTPNSGPTGANTAVQEWLTIDINGTTRYIPCW